MFNDNVSKKFKLTYFVSSFLLSYLFLIIIMYAQYVETNGKLFPDFQILVTTKKIAFIILIILSLCSLSSLFYVKRKISESRGYLRINSEEGRLGYSYNNGSREFILGVLLPVVTTISVPEAPITGIIGVLLIQIILGYFFWNSNELFVNVPLMLFGYSLVVGQKGNQDLLLFVQKQDLKKLLGKNINFVYLGTVTDSNLGIVGEEIGDE
ncbi:MULTISPECIES: hypothetical protein [Streptococcus]|uniref:Uncharacterized protein n=1 Tax=Streptococcus mitis bv. 2 str. F0392 TaxID=768726 RepID=F9P248_STROR|nr:MULTISPECIES: hypothetical protein [Streptococcus]EGR92854.1 hypothetical protein HMPREF9178_0835 [Streptococcus mitis bv. 2 str. F0392]RSJ03945.1 hypothetical protein D8840_04040 [Streptococcus mitis]